MSARQPVRIARRKLAGVLAAVACLVFSAIGLKVNDPPDFEYVDGVRGQTVSISRAEVTAGDVEVGTRLVDDGRVEGETTGMFVTVHLTLAVPGNQRVSLNQANLVTQTRTYDAWSSLGLRADPGFRSDVDAVFEVDPAQIDDLSLEVWYGGIVHGYYQRARIHLGITADNADQWRQAAVGRDLEPDTSTASEALP